MSDLQSLVDTQAKEIVFLRKEREKNMKELHMLRNALTHQTTQAKKSYRDKKIFFDRMSQDILDAVAHLVSIHKKPVGYDMIIKACYRLYAKPQTIRRQLRKLRQDGYLHSPEEALFVPIMKED